MRSCMFEIITVDHFFYVDWVSVQNSEKHHFLDSKVNLKMLYYSKQSRSRMCEIITIDDFYVHF